MNDENLYFFTGTSEIFIKNRIQRIINSYDKKQIAINKYDMETTSLSEVLEDACTIPFLEDIKILILRNPKFLEDKQAPNDSKQFIKYLKNPLNTTVLIIDATNLQINQTNEITKALKNYAMIIDYSNTQEVEIQGWMKRTCGNHNIELRDSAIKLFLEYIDQDQARMVNELEKMMAYVGDNGVIDESVVKLLVTRDLSKEVYHLIEAIINRDLKKATEIYQTLSNQTKDVQGIITMISNEFKTLFTTLKLLKIGYNQHDIARMYNISSGRAYYCIKNAKNFTIDSLANYIKKMADLDYKIKSGKVDKNIGIQLILLTI